MNQRAVITMAFGEAYEKLAHLTRPTIEAYAKRIGATLIVLKRKRPDLSPHWEKLQLGRFLDVYRRVLWIDADIIVKENTPDLFDLVPEDVLGASDEVAQWRQNPLGSRDDFYKEKFDEYRELLKSWVEFPGFYFNSGVMVLGRPLTPLFAEVPAFHSDQMETEAARHFWEQTYLNVRGREIEIPFKDIGHMFNHEFFSPGKRIESHILHYMGWAQGSLQALIPEGKDICWLVRKDLATWKNG
jgi:hypothetical protein